MTMAKALFAPLFLLLAIAAATPSSAQTTSLSAVLLGGNECNSTAPPNGPVCRKGDPNAFGRATVTFPTSTRICVTIQVDNLAGATAAHIHRGRETVNGGIVVTLIPPAAPSAGSPGVSAGCFTVSSSLATAMRANPAAYYINVHNGTFPSGAMRGQLF